MYNRSRCRELMNFSEQDGKGLQMNNNATFDSLPELEQLAIRSQIDGKFITPARLDAAASNFDWVTSAVDMHIKSYGDFTKKCPFLQISELERMAIRYYYRLDGFSGNYEDGCNRIAKDTVLLKKLTLKYKKYASG